VTFPHAPVYGYVFGSLSEMRIEDVAYDGDERAMVGTLAFDEYRVGPRPAVLVCHEGPGLDEPVKDRAVRLASLGYVAFALDYHGGGQPLARDDAMARLDELGADADRTRGLALAGLDLLLAQEQVDAARVAAIGYCFGGAMALELARAGADLKAVVGFHPGLKTPRPADPGSINESILMCSGADDPVVTIEQRNAFENEMREARVADWRIEVYGGVGHCFTNPRVDDLGIPGLAFNAGADRRSWRSMLDLFDERLAPELRD
jgi:dienelactone hydrolase